MSYRFFFLAAFCLVSAVHAATYSAIGDRYFSPYAGGEDLLTFHRIVEKGEGTFFAQIPSDTRWLSRFSRFSELFFFWSPVNELTVVVQHEVFGHGYRAREIGKKYAKVDGYSLGWPFPYGPGGGSTSLRISSHLNSTQEMAIDSAGVEATAILANRLKMKWMQDQKLSPKQATLYLSAQQDITVYIQSMSFFQVFSIDQSHDMQNYLFWLNVTYPQSPLDTQKLKNQSLITLIDPFTYFSMYAWFYYIFTGKEMSLPMIPIGKARYLFGARLGLTPFGPEYYVENFLLSNGHPIYFYGRWGKHAGNRYWGIGLEHPSFFMQRSNLAFGLRGDFWRQPAYVTNKKVFDFMNKDTMTLDRHQTHFSDTSSETPTGSEHSSLRSGIALSLLTTYRLGRSACGLTLQLGGKSSGFLPGESLSGALIARGGFSAHF